jgi:hypothetical protein
LAFRRKNKAKIVNISLKYLYLKYALIYLQKIKAKIFIYKLIKYKINITYNDACILKVREWLENLIPLVDYRYRLDSCNELGLWCLTPLSTIFQLFCGGKRSNQKKHRSATSYWQTLSHNIVSSTPHHERESNSLL